MERVGVRELKAHATQILREVREHRATYIVTVNGEPVATLAPVAEEDLRAQRREAGRLWLADLDAIATELARFPQIMSVEDAIAEERS